ASAARVSGGSGIVRDGCQTREAGWTFTPVYPPVAAERTRRQPIARSEGIEDERAQVPRCVAAESRGLREVDDDFTSRWED
ncbi:MAG TPA: hypothetical protein PLE77_15165, partial [Kiritimatiellia bacterium]|nr:hypothetical protein [Kiritimatiellia bacterium]